MGKNAEAIKLFKSTLELNAKEKPGVFVKANDKFNLMSTEDQIWALVARRLSGEATLEELQGLDELLKQYTGADWQIKIIAGWWRHDIQEEIARQKDAPG